MEDEKVMQTERNLIIALPLLLNDFAFRVSLCCQSEPLRRWLTSSVCMSALNHGEDHQHVHPTGTLGQMLSKEAWKLSVRQLLGSFLQEGTLSFLIPQTLLVESFFCQKACYAKCHKSDVSTTSWMIGCHPWLVLVPHSRLFSGATWVGFRYHK